ncbi:ATP-binding cassette domain-containing protein [Demequina sp.]|uniref:ABC transporter ATP-binding protein n=1 Tax=Demequina sp. TaxID=2050685 RepID=UPI0025C6DEDF|nr:ATP-binding cassette domain-containing protein [Demequina sp.]
MAAAPDSGTGRSRASAGEEVPKEHALRGRLDIARLVPRAGVGLAVTLVVMHLLAGAAPVGFVVATSVVIGRVPAAVEGGVQSAEWDSLVTGFILAAAIFLLAQVTAPVVTAVNARVRRRIDGQLRDDVLTVVSQTTSIAPLEDHAVLDELSEVTGQLDTDWNTPGQAVCGFLALIARYTTLAGFCALLSAASFWWAGVAIFASTMTFRTVNRGGLRRFSAAWRTIMPASRRRAYLRDLTMGDVASKETRIFGINEWLGNRYSSAFWDMYRPVGIARRKIVFLPYLPLTVFGVAITGFVLYSVGHAAAAGTLTLTALALSLQATLGAVSLGQEFEESDVPTQFGMRAMEAMRNLRQLADAAVAREKHDAASDAVAADASDAGRGTSDVRSMPASRLDLRSLRFAYAGGGQEVLSGLDLEIPAGRSTAIVGVNGAGKTTLVKLLTRLYEPTDGAIEADGVNIGHLDVNEWRKQVSVVFQDFIRYEYSAADNIMLGAAHAPRDDAAIREAAHQAGILDAFAGVPTGLDTPLARTYPGGIDLSGGQWQRIAIARSLYALHHGAKVLVLDEPTAALDVRAEAAFFDRFVELTHGVTTLLISHRFSSVRRADHIVVIDQGRVCQQGTHQELMKTGGHYAKLFTLQADRFTRGLDV